MTTSESSAEEPTGTVRVLLADGRGGVLVTVALAWLLALGMRTVVPTLFPQFRSTFGVSDASLGVLFTLLIGTYALTQFPSGLLGDRFGERPVLIASMVGGGLSSLAFAVAPGFAVLAAGAVAFGLGTGLYGPPRATLLSRVFAERDGTALGVTFAAGSVGGAVLPIVAGLVVTRYDWRMVFLAALPLFALVAVGLIATIPRGRPAGASSSVAAVRRLPRAMLERRVLVAGGGFTLVVFAFQGVTAFLPTYLIVAKPLDQPTAAALFGFYFGVGIVAQPLAGYVADRVGDRPVMVGLALVFAAALLTLPAVDGLGTLVALVIPLRAGQSGIGPIVTGYLVAALPEDVQGGGIGLVRTTYLGLGSLGATAAGLLFDRGLADETFLVLGGVVLVATALFTLLPPRE